MLKLLKILRWPLLFLVSLSIIIWCLNFYGYGLTYQYSQSVKPGWYFKYPITNKPIVRGEMVLVNLDKKSYKKLDNFIASRGWKKKGVPLIKEVAGIPGDKICIDGNNFLINNHKVAVIKKYDSKHRLLPNYWRKNAITKSRRLCSVHPDCFVLGASEYLVLGLHSQNSFDGRYFGSINSSLIQSQVKIL
jgi:signal peptidase I